MTPTKKTAAKQPAPSVRRVGVTFKEALAMASAALPEVAESTSYGTPSIAVKGKSFARMWEDNETMVLKIPMVVRDHLMFTKPDVFYITDHYKGYPAVLVRLSRANRKQLAELLEASWREVAPKRLIATFDAR